MVRSSPIDERRIRIAAALCAAVCVLVPVATACRGEENAEDRKLLEALHSDDFDAREAAKKKLIDRGEAVRTTITTEMAKKDLDADYKDYLKSIVAKLKDADVIKAFDTPKRIDLEAKDETVVTVLEKLKAYFGFAAEAKGDAGNRKIALSLKGATFLEAVDAVRRAANLSYDRNEIMQIMFRRRGKNTDETVPALALRENGDDAPVPAAAKGPVLVFFETINYHMSRNIAFGGGGRKNATAQKNFSIQGFLVLEPDLRCSGVGVTKMTGRGANTENISTDNVSLNNYWGGAESKGGFRIYNFHTGFAPQTETPPTLNWKLVTKLQVPVKITEKRFEKLPDLSGKTQEFMGGSFTVNKLERNPNTNGGWKLSYTTTGALMEMGAGGRTTRWNGGTENMTAGNPDFASGMFILDMQGKPLDSNSYSGSNSGTSFRADLELSAEPGAIVFRKPGESQERDFEMEIPDVPLP